MTKRKPSARQVAEREAICRDIEYLIAASLALCNGTIPIGQVKRLQNYLVGWIQDQAATEQEQREGTTK